VTHLRQAMLDELQRRNYAKTAVQYYIQAVERFAKHFHRPQSSSIRPACASTKPTCCATGNSSRGP
jgi:hypothetical protein